MPLENYYDVGLVTVTNGSTAVTLLGSTWGGGIGPVVKAGDEIHILDGASYKTMVFAADVVSPFTAAVFTKAWPGTTIGGPGTAYKITMQRSAADVFAQVRDMVNRSNVAIASLEGNRGGAFYLRYTVSTAAGDPEAGEITFSGVSQIASSVVALDNNDQFAISAVGALNDIGVAVDENPSHAGYLRISKYEDESKYIIFAVNNYTDATSHKTVTVLYPMSYSDLNPFVDGDEVVVSFTRTGKMGTVGPPGTDELVYQGIAASNFILIPSGPVAAPTGVGNTGMGFGSFAALTSGDNNAVYGTHAGGSLTSGFANAFVGLDAGFGVTTGSLNTIIGPQAGSTGQLATAINTVAIGYQAKSTSNNSVAIGNNLIEQFEFFGGRFITVNATSNMFIGLDAGNKTLTALGGALNVGVGQAVMQSLTTANGCVAMGYEAMLYLQTGGGNVGIGRGAMRNSVSLQDCTAVGSDALQNASGIVGATAVGKFALEQNTTGTNNTGIGDSALRFTTGGQQNVALGYVCAEDNITGSYNVFVGQGAATNKTSGDYNVLIGYLAMYVTTGAGSGNVGVGAQVLSNYTGDEATAVGNNSFLNLSNGIRNTGLGASSGVSITTGDSNVFIGWGSGTNVSQLATASNSIGIGVNTYTTASNQVMLGNDSITETILRGAVKFNGAPSPAANDGAALGTTALMWSDGFFASGAVLNFNNGNFTATHAAGQLGLSGNLGVGTVTPDPFARGYNRVLGVTAASGNAAIEINSASGSTAFLDLGSGGTRLGYIAAAAAVVELGSIGAIPFTFVTNAVTRMEVGAAGGVIIGAPAGGNKGNGTLNATGVYDDNVLLTDYVFDRFLGRAANENYSPRVREMFDGLDTDMFSPAAFGEYWRKNGKLYGMPDLNDCIDGVVTNYSLGAMIQKLMQVVELQAIHIESHERRLAA